jgi:hypothetical protein
MSLNLRIVYFSLTGALGALAAWFVLDVILDLQPASPYMDALLNGALIGVAIGVAVNGFNGIMEFKVWPVVRGVLVGLAGGLLGGALGLLLGEFFYQTLGNNDAFRILGWAIFGFFLGLVDGVLALSPRRMLYAGAGGLLGGLLGGIVFSLLARYSDLPNTARALGFALLGALTGLFIGLLPTMLRNAWLKVISSGRNEGKEILVDKKRVVIGADARCELALYGDPGIAGQHAEIQQNAGQFILKPLGQSRVIMEDRLVSQHSLQDEDTFQVGQETLIFRKKSR